MTFENFAHKKVGLSTRWAGQEIRDPDIA